ncbi:MAG: iron-containing alcohol dehydrogenase [Eubacterium sp.]|nr:iron-containing alcohol dehydrogenase [Eubacterium sp.]
MALNFQFYQKTKVLVGAGAVKQLGELADLIGGRKALVVADPGITAAGIAQKVLDVLKDSGMEAVLFDGNEPNPPITACEKGYEVCQREKCDYVIGVGGGSNLDCAKGINILRFNQGPLIQYANMAKPFDVGSGLIMIPTTSGTGSEMSDGAILSDENHIKQNFIADSAFADYAILDPELMTGMPPQLTAFTGLDALAHALESVTGTLSNPYLEFVCEQTVRDIARYLPRAVADGNDLKAREKMAVASNIGGFELVYGHTCAGHSIAQTVGAFFNVPHGAACGYVTPWITEYNAAAVPETVRTMMEAMGLVFDGTESPVEIGAKSRDFLLDFVYNKCKVPPLAEAFPDYDESRFEECAAACRSEFFQQFNPRRMSKDDCLEIIRKMYAYAV